MQKSIYILTFISLFSFACNNTSSEKNTNSNQAIALSTDAKTNVEKLINSYLSLKDALVKTNSKEAQVQATQLGEITKSLGQEASIATQIAQIQKSALEISATESIEVQRLAFSSISHATYDLAKTTAVMQGKLYKQFCPMAFDDKGDYWLSSEKQVMNPYFGSMMLHCGKVTEAL